MKFTVVLSALMLLTSVFAHAAPDCAALSAIELEAILDASQPDPALRSVAYSNMSVECEKQAQGLDEAALHEKNGKKSLALTMRSVKARENSSALLQSSAK